MFYREKRVHLCEIKHLKLVFTNELKQCSLIQRQHSHCRLRLLGFNSRRTEPVGPLAARLAQFIIAVTRGKELSLQRQSL